MTLYTFHTENNKWTKCPIAQRKMIEAMGRGWQPFSYKSHVALGGIFHLAKISPKIANIMHTISNNLSRIIKESDILYSVEFITNTGLFSPMLPIT